MSLFDVIVLILAGLAGGVANALAGGGTFFTFPALLAIGLPPTVASATSATSLWAGRLSAIVPQSRRINLRDPVIRRRITVALLGGATGAGLLLITQERTFLFIVPWLLLIATVNLLYARHMGALLRRLLGRRLHQGLEFLLEYLLAVYGGYFGAGLGVMTLAFYAVFTRLSPNAANALKNVITALILTIAVIIFLTAGRVNLIAALFVMLGAVPGGWAGGWLAERLDPHLLRRIISVLAVFITLYYFVKIIILRAV